MTEALVKSEFMGIEIRIVETDPSRPVIPLVDIAKGIGYAPHKLAELYERNKELLEEDAQTPLMVTGNQVAPIPHTCLTREGIIGIIMKLDYLRVKDSEKRERIKSFQRWAKKTLAREMQMQTKIVKDHGEGWSSVAIEHLNFAKGLMQHNPALDPGMCMAIGIRQAEKATGMDLSAYKKLIPPAAASAQEEYITATQIGREIGEFRRAEEVNRYLEQNGYLFRDEGGNLLLTELGAQYGRVFPGAFNSGHCGYYIKWRRSVIPAAKIRENNPRKIR